MARFNAALEAGEIDDTQEVYVAEIASLWKNGEFHPYVYLDDYLKKGEAIDFANDLTGVLEATPEEFVFRASAGTKSIRDESAVIRRIKGNTSVWGQYVKNGDFAEGTRYFAMINSTLSDNGDGSITITHKLDSSCGVSTIFDTHIPRGHKILAVADYQRDSASSSRTFLYLRRNGGGFDSRIISGIADAKRRVDCAIITATDDITGFNLYPFFDSPVGTQSVVYTMAVYDLTAIFGVGNEPTTLEEFKKTYPESYYPYCAPEVRSMRATGIETIGANAFNKDSVVGGLINADGTVTSNDIYSVAKIEVVPNEVYTLSDVANAANTTYTYALYDSDDRFISVGEIKNSVTKPISVSGDVTIPMNARYIRVVVHNDYLDSCCVNLKHTGTITTEEATYFKEVRMLPDIAKYFSDGMHGIGGVFDEINENNVVNRLGVVDLGTLNWGVVGTQGNVDMRFYSAGLQAIAKGTENTAVIGNIVNNRYTSISADGTYLRNKGLSIDLGGLLHIYDPDMNTADDLADMVASLQGVMLVYELAEPIITPITEPLQLDYKVADFGTEKMLNDLPSSPFRADIVYQFNAEGRIRDNSRNIERLEEHTKNMATMEDVINAIPTEVATATQLEEYTVTDGSQRLYPNIMYEYPLGIGQAGVFVMPNIVKVANRTYDNRWMLRLPSIATSSILSYPYTIAWKDGVAPTFSEPCALEIYLKESNSGQILGEWKIYREVWI